MEDLKVSLRNEQERQGIISKQSDRLFSIGDRIYLKGRVFTIVDIHDDRMVLKFDPKTSVLSRKNRRQAIRNARKKK
jgi:hypothetical protein